jgi:hypothetical protein
MAIVGDTVTVKVGAEIEDRMGLPNTLDTLTADNVIVAVPVGAVLARTAPTLAIVPLAIVVVLIPASTQLS